MDFTPTEEQEAARELAARVFGDLATHERLRAAGTGTDAELWKALCAAGLPGAVEDTGLLGLVLLLEEQGRVTAQVPFAATCVYGLLAVTRHGTAEQRARLLPGLRDGTTVITGALPAGGVVSTAHEARGRATAPADGGELRQGRAPNPTTPGPPPGPIGEPLPPVSGGESLLPVSGGESLLPVSGGEPLPPASGGRRLSGVVDWVPWLRDATHVLVPDADRALWLVRTEDAAAVESVELTAPWSAGRLVLAETPAERLGAAAERPGAPTEARAAAHDDVLAAARIAFAGLQAGVCAGSLARAVAYTSVREQFGRPLATHQAVQLRAADAHMDTEAIRVTAYEAAWRFDEGLDAEAAALTAAWWASEAGKRVVHAGQHLHGGMGADLDHPVHRHFLWGRQLDAYLGCGTELLAELGDLLAKGDPS
ncbi:MULTISPECIES: acyl-CoA dehydrogenase family protein [Streptomyces]|uniref:Acyl-CoA dehydrogenase n=1 Tax=Streptomyces viridochromogenes TaxID=1938 RepID=A0A0L8LBC6_STRVR|nr:MULTISPECIES: acyl-CoA dehydrogenase family protein [Streptomyces]KOG35553.1 acyl-CoA dehydrogenase [Streptomyces viridochromogenes]